MHGSAKFVHRCLALRTPVLPAVLFRRIRQVERRFFSLLRSRLTLFEKPNKTQQNQEKFREEYFQRDNRDQRVPGLQTGPMSTLTGAEWSCARSVLAIITSVSSETNWQAVKRKHKKDILTPEHEEKNQLTWLCSPPRWMHSHREADPEEQCDRDANDATKSFNAESYDFDTV